MLEALWSMEFFSNLGIEGTGVAVLETGRILGGDASYIYVWSYDVKNEIAHAEVKITHYAGERYSVIGNEREFIVRLQGSPSRDNFELYGEVVGKPGVKIRLRLTRRAELP